MARVSPLRRLTRIFVRTLPFDRPAVLVGVVLVCAALATVIHQQWGQALDRPMHDAFAVQGAREAWTHTAVAILDDKLPTDVSRIQLLPVLARASERLVALGAKGVYLDGSILAQPDALLPYATCIDHSSSTMSPVARVLRPQCVAEEGEEGDDDTDTESGTEALGCDAEPLPALAAPPMALSSTTAAKFLLPPPMLPLGQGQEDACVSGHRVKKAPLAQLVGIDAQSQVEVVCTDTARVDHDDGVVRFVPRFDGHVVDALLQRTSKASLQTPSSSCKVADTVVPCSRVRFSQPTTTSSTSRPLVPVSTLAACDAAQAAPLRPLVEGRVVVIQVASFFSDLHATPLSVGFLSDRRFSPGAHIIADAVETLVHDDAPRTPHDVLALVLLLLGAGFGVWSGAYLRPHFALVAPVVVPVVIVSVGLAVAHNGEVVLLPVAGPFLGAVFGIGGSFLLHFAFSTKASELTARYLPPPVRKLLLSDVGGGTFEKQDRHAVVLMTDLVGYTTACGKLGSARAVISFLNTYFDATMPKVQDAHGGWLEDYVGDLVCFYWPSQTLLADHVQKVHATRAALELARDQRAFFERLPGLDVDDTDAATLRDVQQVVGAGIGLAAGPVAMGNMGMSQGVQKFGILGDPLNLSSRVEALTRFFDTDILITEDLVEAAEMVGKVRFVARVVVKGRSKACGLYALYDHGDPRAAPERIEAWMTFVEALAHGRADPDDDGGFALDAQCLWTWVGRDLLREDDHGPCFALDEK